MLNYKDDIYTLFSVVSWLATPSVWREGAAARSDLSRYSPGNRYPRGGSHHRVAILCLPPHPVQCIVQFYDPKNYLQISISNFRQNIVCLQGLSSGIRSKLFSVWIAPWLFTNLLLRAAHRQRSEKNVFSAQKNSFKHKQILSQWNLGSCTYIHSGR